MTISDCVSAPTPNRFAHTLDEEIADDHVVTEEPVSMFALRWLAAALEDERVMPRRRAA